MPHVLLIFPMIVSTWSDQHCSYRSTRVTHNYRTRNDQRLTLHADTHCGTSVDTVHNRSSRQPFWADVSQPAVDPPNCRHRCWQWSVSAVWPALRRWTVPCRYQQKLHTTTGRGSGSVTVLVSTHVSWYLELEPHLFMIVMLAFFTVDFYLVIQGWRMTVLEPVPWFTHLWLWYRTRDGRSFSVKT